MADNTTVAEESLSKPSSLVKGQSGSSGTGSMSSTASSKTHSLKHGLNMSHTGSGIKGVAAAAAAVVACTSEMNKHHHHHHHHHHHNHGHSHNNPHVIHRTTSESLRLGSDIASSSVSGHSSSSASTNCNSSASNTSGSGHTNAQVTNQRKPKTSSFQITSVTVGNKLSADNGEDSADDLDESHTDDNSRITDLENETPSVSEDTFSKEDVFFSSNALGAAPVIPTSSQYGLVIVDPDLGGVGTGGQTLSNVHVSVTDAGINIVGPAGTKLCDADQKDLQHRNERFKVVKIESTEPFKRGRWMCMDYLDHTTLQQSQPNSESPSGGQSLAGSSGNPMTNDSGVNVTENHIDATEDPPDINLHGHMQGVSPGQTLQNPISGASADSVRQAQTQPNVTASGGENISNSIHAQTLTHVPNAPQVSMSHQSIPQSLPHVSVQQTSTTQQPHSQTSINFAPVSNSSLQGQSQPAQFYANNQQQQQPQNVAISHVHGATLPTNITMQNGIPTNLATVAEQPTPQEISQPIQTVQPVQSSQQIQQNALPSTSIPSSIGLQEHGNISVSTSLPQQQQQQQQQPASITGTVLEQKPQNASQTQVSGESYVPHSASQSYVAPQTSTSSISNVAGAASIGQEINTDISIAGMSQTPQSSGVISPAGAGTPASSTVPSIDSSIQSGIVASASSVISEGAPTSSVSSISDPASLITTPQPQPQVPIATSLQSQQSIIASEESQSAAGETDNERISSLAFALTSQNHPSGTCTPTNIINAPETFKDQSIGPHFYRSHNLVNIKKSNNFLSVDNPNQSLKLGQKLTLNIKQNVSNETANINWQQSNVTYGIPIPKPKNSPLELGISRSASPTSGGREISPFFCDSLSTSPNSAILASSYETPSSFIHPSLKEIGKTLSTPLPIKSTIATNQNNKYDFYVNQIEQQSSKDNNSASGTSAVAIDNKIEQAMDLVKSHLMIAVREEVEVLKEKIAELMDRINQLELENTILKANVSQETLSQLSATIQTAATTNSATAPPIVQKPPQNTNTSNGPVS